MGPPDYATGFSLCLILIPTITTKSSQLVPYSLHYPCHWLQIAVNTQDPVHSVFLHTNISGTQFDDSWGVMPIIDWVRTPLGYDEYQRKRRWKDNIWLRTTETILPNFNQAGAFWERPDDEKAFQRVAMTRFFRPIDETNTHVMGWRYFNDVVDPGKDGDATQVGKDKDGCGRPA